MKKFSLLILTFLCSLLFTLPVWADDRGFIQDRIGYFQAYEEETLEAEAASLAEAYDFLVYFAIADSGQEDLDSQAQNLYQSLAGDANGVLLMVDADRSQWSIYYGGQGKSLLNLDKEDLLWTSFSKESDFFEGVKSYFTTVRTTFEKPALVVDEAGLLNSQEEADLLAKLEEISQRQELDVVVLTVTSINGFSPQDYADNYFDYNGYGQGPNHDGVLLLINMGDRDWHISTTGYGFYALTDAGMAYMSEKFLDPLSAGDYAQAFHIFADLVDQFVTQAKTDLPYDVGSLPKDPPSLLWIPASGLLGLVLAWLVTAYLRGQLTTVQSRTDAREYLKNGSFKLTNSQDLFLYRNVSKVPRPKSNNSSSGFRGGSSSHTSFSGTSHGGSGGKF